MVYVPSDVHVNVEVPTTPRVDAVYSGGTETLVKFADVAAAAGATTEVVAAVTGKKIRVRHLAITPDETGGSTHLAMQWRSAATALTGRMLVINDTVFIDSNIEGIFETAAGEALNLNLTAGSSNGEGYVQYVEVG